MLIQYSILFNVDIGIGISNETIKVIPGRNTSIIANLSIAPAIRYYTISWYFNGRSIDLLNTAKYLVV